MHYLDVFRLDEVLVLIIVLDAISVGFDRILGNLRKIHLYLFSGNLMVPALN